MIPRLLHRFAVFTAALTLVLLGAGGLVTSHGVGMAVPDWPNTFGYNMFFFPISQWVGGVFYEHSHRLIASVTGLCTSILALWLYGRNARPFLRWSGGTLVLVSLLTLVARPGHRADAVVAGFSGLAALVGSFGWPRCEPAKPWLRRLGLAAFFAVVLQGVLGGLRVVLFKDQIGIFHATLAQLFFALTCALALFTSSWWAKRFGSPWAQAGESAQGAGLSLPQESVRPVEASEPSIRLVWFCVGGTLLILAQLVLGATMRHQHAGLAIPDFPTAYGKFWPAMDSQSVAIYNQHRIEVVDLNPITSLQIALQMVHRVGALLILIAIASSAWLARRGPGPKSLYGKLTLAWLALVLVQGFLGAATIWSNKAADIATTHVLTGALSLALGTCLCIILLTEAGLVRQSSQSSTASATRPRSSFGTTPSPALGLD